MSDGTDSNVDVLRPAAGQFLTVAVGVLSAIGLIVTASYSGVADAARIAPWCILVSGTCWAMFWLPKVSVNDEQVKIVNVLRTVILPMSHITDIHTRWGLTLITPNGRYHAWAAPAPGAAHLTKVSVRQEIRSLPKNTYESGNLRPGDLPTSHSGSTALIIRRRWEKHIAGGAFDAEGPHTAAVNVVWHVRLILVGLFVVAVSILSLNL